MSKHTVVHTITIPSIDLIAALKTNAQLAEKEHMPRVAERMYGFASEVDYACSNAWQDCIDWDKVAGSYYTCEVVITAHLPELDED